MLNTTNLNSFSHKVSVDTKAFQAAPTAPQSPKATGLIGDNWTYKPREPQPTLIIPSAPAPTPQQNWFEKLLDYVMLANPSTAPAVILKKTAPAILEKVAPIVAQDAREIGEGLWGVAQNAWNAVTSWFSPPACPPAPAAPEAPEAPEPTTHFFVPFANEPVPKAEQELTADQLAEQERQIRRRTRVVLKRDATEAEVAEYKKRLAAGATMGDVHEALQNLPEAQIARIFKEEVGRDIDDRGRAFWMNEYNQGEDLEDIRTRIRVIVGKSKSE